MTDKIKLFCIPYAGGSANIYNHWQSMLGEDIELCPIELAGRGRRITEKLYANLDEAVNDVYNQVLNRIGNCEYAFFGHSMGAFITYELTQKIKSKGLPGPVHVFFSGRTPPGTPRIKKLFSKMNSSEFENAILELGGTPPDFFQYPELKKIFMPLLRSDFSISETVVDRQEIIPLDCDISVLLGENEGIPHDVALGWHSHSSKECKIQYVQGDHFFLIKETRAVTNIINKSLITANVLSF